MNALSIKNLFKRYSNTVEALKGISLEVKEGDFFGLLGPNGAGKSTTIGIITGLVNKTEGKVVVFGKDIDIDCEEARELIGIVPQEFNFSIFEKVYNIVIDQAGYYGVPRTLATERTEKYLKLLGLWDLREAQSRTLSGGMKRRLMIARGLVHEPKLLILDEPTAGVDVELRRGMWDFLVELNKKGTTIILTTHYLEEAEVLCRNIAIINKGIIIENTSKKELLNKLETQSYVFDLTKALTPTQQKRSADQNFPIKQIDETTISVEFKPPHHLNELFASFEKQGLKVKSMRNKSNRLEELFLNLVEEKK